MKKTVFLMLCASLCISFMATSCDKKDEKPAATEQEDCVTITEGIYGTVVERYGDWMPVIGEDSPRGGERPLEKRVYVYEYTKTSDFDYGHYFSEFPIDKMPKSLVAIGQSKSNGFYEISLNPGTYSVFIEDNGKLCANGGDGYGGINPVVISADSIVLMNLVLNHAVY